MKMVYSEQVQKLVPTSYASTSNDALPLPGGKKIAELSNGALATLLAGTGVPGVSHSQGRDANMASYAAHLAAIHKQAGDTAVAKWLASK